jgi:CRP-like cAMP-binding protein
MFYNFLKGFAEIPPSDFDLIIRSAREKKIEAKEVLLKEGAVAKELFFVLDGILKIVSTSE